MSYHHHNQQLGFGQRQPALSPWHSSLSGLLGLPPGLPHYSALSQPPPFSFLFQQQNNFINSSVSLPGPYPASRDPLMFPPVPSPSWLPRPLSQPSVARPAVRNPPAKQVQVIDLDSESYPEAIVISDSEEVAEQLPPSSVLRPVGAVEEPPRRKLQAPGAQLRQMVQKRIEQVGGIQNYLYRSKREPLVPSRKNLAAAPVAPPSLPPQDKNQLQQKEAPPEEKPLPREEKKEPKVAKKKSINHERYSYRLKPHERKLALLSDCRDYFPGMIMVGPQFQATLPRFRLFSKGEGWLWRRRANLLLRVTDQ